MIVWTILLPVIYLIYVVKGDDCEYSTPDGIIDLRTLGDKSRPKYHDIQDTNPSTFLKYSFNGCFAFSTKDSCQNAAACATDISSATSRLLAKQAGRTFSYNQGLTTMIYTDGMGTIVRVFVVCKDNELMQASRIDDKSFVFNIESKCGCPGKCTYIPDKASKGLTGGGVFMIILFSVIVIYIIGGMIFLRYIQHEQGVNLIPHRTFWHAIGNNFIFGVRFTFEKISGKNSYEKV